MRVVAQAVAVRVTGLETGGVAGLETGGVAWMQDFLTLIGDEHHVASDDIDKFIRSCVPVSLTRPSTWRQA
jgi:hypothetical protein